MEETGIIRRLDALGRVVIPREFRKLNRIEVGDPLEIKALGSGEIIVKKVDLSSQLKSVGALAISALGLHTNKTIGVCSPEEWLDFSVGGKFGHSGTPLSDAAARAVMSPKSKVLKCADAGISSKNALAAFYPVYGDTGIFGALVLFTDTEPNETENMLMETVAQFTGKSMQKF